MSSRANVFGTDITYETKAELDKKIDDLKVQNQLSYFNMERSKKVDKTTKQAPPVKPTEDQKPVDKEK